MTSTTQVLGSIASAALLEEPDRRGILLALRAQPDSAAGLARRLGETRQRVNHHMRVMEDGGLLRLVEERRRGNCMERVLAPVADRLLIDPLALHDTPLEPQHAGDRHSAAHLIALNARAVHEVNDLAVRANERGARLATASLESSIALPSPAATSAFVDELAAAIADVIAKHHRPGAESRNFRVILGAYPAPPPSQEHDDAGEQHG